MSASTPEPPPLPALEPGNFSLILHRVGMRKVSVVKTVYELQDRPDLAVAKELVERAPVLLFTRISEASAEAIADRLRSFEAEALVRRSVFGEQVGDAVRDLHPAGSAFTVGPWRLVLVRPSQPDIFTKLALLQLIPDLRPVQLDALLERPSQPVLERIDRATAQRLADALEESGAEVAIEFQP